MEYDKIQRNLNELCAFSAKSGIERFKRLMELALNPHEKLNVIHVAGTNGKGSVCSFISSVLIEAGYKTGLFLSPFVFEFGERISINKKMIPAQEFMDILQSIYAYIESISSKYGKFTQFEIIAAVAFIYFSRNNCDFVVLETGIGGRLDITNIFKSPIVTAITSISYDHMNMLGDTLEQIAFEKSGIIKQNTDIVIYPNVNNKILKIFQEVSKEKCSKCVVANYVNIEKIGSTDFGNKLRLNNKEFNIKLQGNHQINNLKTAVAVLDILKNKGFNLRQKEIIDGFSKAYLPGRMEVLHRKPTIILDGAHNKEALMALCKYVQENFYNRKKIGIIAMMKDKVCDELFESMGKYFDEIITVEFEEERAMNYKELKVKLEPYFKKVSCMRMLEALSYAKNKLTQEDVVCIFGSFYIANSAKNAVDEIFELK